MQESIGTIGTSSPRHTRDIDLLIAAFDRTLRGNEKTQSAENIPTSKQRLKTFGGKNMGKASGPHLQTCNSSYQSERGSVVVTYNTLQRDKTFRKKQQIQSSGRGTVTGTHVLSKKYLSQIQKLNLVALQSELRTECTRQGRKNAA